MLPLLAESCRTLTHSLNGLASSLALISWPVLDKVFVGIPLLACLVSTFGLKELTTVPKLDIFEELTGVPQGLTGMTLPLDLPLPPP